MSTRVLIIGSKGMAGHVIYEYLKSIDTYVVADVSRNDDFFKSVYKIDISGALEIERVLFDFKPHVVINCIGILNANAEENPDNAILINSYLPHFIAKVGAILKFKLIHISTDCVFSGARGNYQESDITDGTGFYAKTKALGEVLYNENLTLRTSIIGPELKNNGIGLFNWFMHQSGTITGYSKAIWTGITTIELARQVHVAISNNYFGLYHVVNNQKITKYDLLTLFKEVFEKDDIIIEREEKYSVDKSLINSSSDFVIGSYPSMIVEMRMWMENKKYLYPIYFGNQ